MEYHLVQEGMPKTLQETTHSINQGGCDLKAFCRIFCGDRFACWGCATALSGHGLLDGFGDEESKHTQKMNEHEASWNTPNHTMHTLQTLAILKNQKHIRPTCIRMIINGWHALLSSVFQALKTIYILFHPFPTCKSLELYKIEKPPKTSKTPKNNGDSELKACWRFLALLGRFACKIAVIGTRHTGIVYKMQVSGVLIELHGLGNYFSHYVNIYKQH